MARREYLDSEDIKEEKYTMEEENMIMISSVRYVGVLIKNFMMN